MQRSTPNVVDHDGKWKVGFPTRPRKWLSWISHPTTRSSLAGREPADRSGRRLFLPGPAPAESRRAAHRAGPWMPTPADAAPLRSASVAAVARSRMLNRRWSNFDQPMGWLFFDQSAARQDDERRAPAFLPRAARKGSIPRSRSDRVDPHVSDGKESADKPGSVVDSHSSGMRVAAQLWRPTRKPMWAHVAAKSTARFPIWSCSRWGLPCRECCHSRGALLPHPFTLAVAACAALGRFAFCCTFRGLTPPRRYLAPRPSEPGLSSMCLGTQRLPGRLLGRTIPVGARECERDPQALTS